MKKVIIINGPGRCGKDTFASFLGEEFDLYKKVSSVDKIKEMYESIGISKNNKTQEYRVLMSITKKLVAQINNGPTEWMLDEIAWFAAQPGDGIIVVDIREPEEIDKLKNYFKLAKKSILTVRVDRDVEVPDNPSDQSVFDYVYDVIIDNNGTLDDLKDSAHTFAERFIWGGEEPVYFKTGDMGE